MTKPSLTPSSFRGRAIYVVQQILLHILLPFSLIYTYVRLFSAPDGPNHSLEPLGLGIDNQTPCIWLHSNTADGHYAVEPLLRELVHHGETVLLTYGSAEEMARGQQMLTVSGPRHALAPQNLFWAAAFFLFRAKPKVFIQCDDSFNAALLRESAGSALPCLRLNAHLLPRDLQGRALLRDWALAHDQLFTHIFVPNEQERQRFLRVGMPAERLSTLSLSDRPNYVDPRHQTLGKELRQGWPAEAKVLLFAETEAPEEDALLDIFLGLRALPGLEDLRLIWAPRSQKRFEPLAEDLGNRGLSLTRRSYWLDLESAALPSKVDVLLADSLAEMNIWYPMADLTFVGGSLVNHGGHEVLQPMIVGSPVIMGPSIHRMERLIQAAVQAGALQTSRNTSALYDAMALLLQDDVALKAMGKAAHAFADDRRNPARRIHAMLQEITAKPEQPPAQKDAA